MYGPISASGPNAAILHYGHAGAPNDRQMRDGDNVLVDFGCEYYHYGSGGRAPMSCRRGGEGAIDKHPDPTSAWSPVSL